MSQQPAPVAQPLHTSGALVSGGTSGVGLATALHLARAGVPRIALLGRDPDRGAAAQQQVIEAGAQSVFVSGDTVDPHDSTRVVDIAADFLGGRVDIVMSAVAPRGHLGPLDKQDPVELERVLRGLVLPVMQVNRAALVTPIPHLVRA
jgi:NAD(P)-dependent dehydrogenase (short-subunit alcohol dehydrogenase family)